MHLNVSEVFYSIQGEGKYTGTPAVFLRLGGCNLLCTWCDTVEVWRRHTKTNFADVLQPSYIDALRNGAHLVITGGEPLLHQGHIVEFVNWLYTTHKVMPFIEIETNGTIKTTTELFGVVNQWNVSPKLANSGMTLDKRFKSEVLKDFDKFDNTTFKFVISREADIVEVFHNFGFLNRAKLMFMPCGQTQAELSDVRLMVVEHCIKSGIAYCDRLHIIIWNQKTGV